MAASISSASSARRSAPSARRRARRRRPGAWRGCCRRRRSAAGAARPARTAAPTAGGRAPRRRTSGRVAQHTGRGWAAPSAPASRRWLRGGCRRGRPGGCRRARCGPRPARAGPGTAPAASPAPTRAETWPRTPSTRPRAAEDAAAEGHRLAQRAQRVSGHRGRRPSAGSRRSCRGACPRRGTRSCAAWSAPVRATCSGVRSWSCSARPGRSSRRWPSRPRLRGPRRSVPTVPPGATPLTRTSGASSRASCMTAPRSANFELTYSVPPRPA